MKLNDMEKTLDDFIAELQQIKPEWRKLPVKIRAENGLLFEPRCFRLAEEFTTCFDEPNQMIISYLN